MEFSSFNQFDWWPPSLRPKQRIQLFRYLVGVRLRCIVLPNMKRERDRENLVRNMSWPQSFSLCICCMIEFPIECVQSKEGQRFVIGGCLCVRVRLQVCVCLRATVRAFLIFSEKPNCLGLKWRDRINVSISVCLRVNVIRRIIISLRLLELARSPSHLLFASLVRTRFLASTMFTYAYRFAKASLDFIYKYASVRSEPRISLLFDFFLHMNKYKSMQKQLQSEENDFFGLTRNLSRNLCIEFKWLSWNKCIKLDASATM